MDKNNKEIIDSEKNSESPLNLNRVKLQNEMIYMKEDILKDLKNFERNYSEKFTKSNKLISERLEEFEQKLNSFNQKLFEISQASVENKLIKEKIEKILDEKMTASDRILKLNIKIDNFEKKFIEKNSYIENILNDSIIYPGIIGNNCKFVNFHGFIDYTISQLSKYYIVSQKNSLEINTIRKNFDSFNKEIKAQNETILGSANQYARKILFEEDNKYKDILKEQEKDIKIMKAENEMYSNKFEQTINDIKNKIKKEIEDIENKSKKENEKINDLILNNNKDLNNIKISLEKLNEELKEIDKKINIELQKKEITKEITKETMNNNNDLLIDDNEMVVNKYIKGEINEEQYLVYKQFNKLNLMMKNYLNEFLEKSAQSLKYNNSAKFKRSPSINFASQLTSSLNNIISEITMERTKRRTVNNLLHCLELKLGKEKNEGMFNRRNNLSKTDFKTINQNNDLKIKTFDNVYNNIIINDFGYKTFQISDRNKNTINQEDLKINFNEESKNNERSIVKEVEITRKKKENDNRSFIKNNIINERNIIIDCNKNKNQDIIEILEYNNKMTNNTQDKTNVNKMRKGLIYSILNNNKENDYLNISQKIIMKDNIIKKIKNKTKKEEELKQTKLKKIITQKKEINQDKMNISDPKSFKGKKYLGYEKSFDAKIKEKLISNDINYKEKMKKIKEGMHRDLSFTPNYNLIIPKTKRYVEAENFEKMINNLHSYLGENINNNNK